MERKRFIYTGLPRDKIDWFPRIDQKKCRPLECNYHCVSFCPFGVFSKKVADNDKNIDDPVVEVSHPYECNVGDESCRFQCPYDAIYFPTRQELKEMLQKVREKYSQLK